MSNRPKRSLNDEMADWRPSASNEGHPPPFRKRRPVLAAKDVGSVFIRKKTTRIQFGTKELDAQQEEVLRAAEAGRNIFLTGGAGTGKSFVLREMITRLKSLGRIVAVTASTGCAAVAIGGTTVHSFLGLGFDDHHAFPQGVRATKQRLSHLNVLVIDEISMIDAKTFDRVEKVCYIARKRAGSKLPRKPFSGLQIILCGDFCQLPPVTRNQKERPTQFCFESKLWKKCKFSTFTLKVSHRQDDVKFSALLDELRFGVVSQSTLTLLTSKSRESTLSPEESSSPGQWTKLFPCRFQVESENKSRLESLSGFGVRYIGIDEIHNQLLRYHGLSSSLPLDNFPSPLILDLKIGSRVLCTKNLNQKLGIVNGTFGEVVGFVEEKKQSFQTFGIGGERQGRRSTRRILQLPQRTARQYIDCNTNDEFHTMRVNDATVLPLVKFENGTTSTIGKTSWDITGNDGEVVYSRWQLPLALGWALSIHKSQGMSIDNLEVDLSRCFDYGQAYVALSRARSMSGLHVKGFSNESVKVHPKVLEFYQKNGR